MDLEQVTEINTTTETTKPTQRFERKFMSYPEILASPILYCGRYAVPIGNTLKIR